MKFKTYTRKNRHNEFKEFYEKLPKKDRQKLIAIITQIEQQGLIVAIKMEWIKKLDTNLYEIRSKISSNIQRGLYFHDTGDFYIITHGFTKKTQKTPRKEIKHAKELRKEYFDRKEKE